MRKHAFTLIELLVVIAIIAILAAILFPVFAQAKISAKMTGDLSNIKQTALATLMYAGDYDDNIPRMDNNGSCLYGDRPCATPDWGNASNDSRDRNARPMFLNVIQPYIKNAALMYSPQVGKTDWQGAIAARIGGITWGGAYDPAREDVYYGAVGMCAVNIEMIERWGIDCHLGQVARPSDIVLLGNSVWDNDLSAQLAVGNTGIWPNKPNSRCTAPPLSYGQGWTWYLHRAKGRSGSRAIIESGFSNVALVDGHSKAYKYNTLEACDFNTSVNLWVYTRWDPRYD